MEWGACFIRLPLLYSSCFHWRGEGKLAVRVLIPAPHFDASKIQNSHLGIVQIIIYRVFFIRFLYKWTDFAELIMY